MNTALIITTYNRPKYLSRCFESLLKIDFPKNFFIIIVDDASTDAETNILNNNFYIHGVSVTKVIKQENKGIKDSLKIGVNLAIGLGCETFINLDADAIVNPKFITRLLELKTQFPNKIVGGFNSKNKENNVLRNPIINEFADCIEKRYCNGINMCFSKHQFFTIIEPTLEQKGNWDFDTHQKTDSFIIAKPSLVQHIGIESSMGHNINQDVAFDFDQKELTLKNVTAFCIDRNDKEGAERAMEISTKNIDFGEVILITDHDYFNGREGYSVFCIKDMYKFINTSHVLILHPDGYVQNYKAWDDSWLQYDYIGATWGYKDNMNVGNGGFSLRSKKLLEIISKYDLHNGVIEDDFICRKIRKELEDKHDIKFAPEEVANRFSIEAYGAKVFTDMQGHKANTYTNQFGFHGYSVIDLPIPPLSKKNNTIRKKQEKIIPHFISKKKIKNKKNERTINKTN